MATVTGLTKARMLEIENASIVDARLEDNDLVLTNFGGDDINVGNVKGDRGEPSTLADLGVVASATELNYVDGVTGAIQTQLNGKSATGHTHDDRYYTESEMDSALAGKAAASHTHAASEVTSGEFDLARIPSLPASKITSGEFDIARIPVITPAKMTAATEGAIGAAERATNAETLTGTDTTRYISPANLKHVIDTGIRANMVKTTQQAYTADTWLNVTGWSGGYNAGLAVDVTNGRFTILTAGRYSIEFYQRWGYFGSDFMRTAAIVLGTSAPDGTTGGNVLTMNSHYGRGFYVNTLIASDVALSASNVITFWVRSETSSNFNATSGTDFATHAKQSHVKIWRV